MTDARSVRDAVCEAMGSAVPEGFRPQASPSSLVAAGADEPESVAVDGVAADAAVFDTDTAAAYRDGVEHRLHLDRPPVASQGAPQHSERDGETVEPYFLKCGVCDWIAVVPREAGLPEGCPHCHNWRVSWSMVHERPTPLAPNDWHRPDDANRERESVRSSRLARWQRQP